MSAVTEKEARKKLCCGPKNCGIYLEIDEARVCCGSQCMAWQWCEVMTDGPDSYISEPGPKGYCGLAGLPLELQ